MTFEMTPLTEMNPLEYLARPGSYCVLQEKRLENVEKKFYKQHEASKYLRNAGREIYNAFVELHQVYPGSGTIIPEVIGSDCLALVLKYLNDRIRPSLLRFKLLQTNGRRLVPEADVFLCEVGWDPQILLALNKDLVELREKDDFVNGDKISIVHDHLVDIAEAVDFNIYDE
ncbi:hypothetical protein E8E11_004408 [Didymella keratinophila]|nr:hypothetical protein E8E11_004408 [Didymella keratinophila]